jgi:hypothetical protein
VNPRTRHWHAPGTRTKLEEKRSRGRPAFDLVDVDDLDVGPVPHDAEEEPANAAKAIDGDSGGRHAGEVEDCSSDGVNSRLHV